MSLFSVLGFGSLGQYFASAGGGGSGGDSGGGEILALVSYVPMHFLGRVFRKKWQKNEDIKIPLQIAGWVVALVYGGLLAIFGFIGFILAVLSLVGMGAGLYGWFGGVVKQSKKVKQALTKASATDSSWNEEQLLGYARQVFAQFQLDWSKQDFESFKRYSTTKYAQHNSLLIGAMKQMGRANIVDSPEISDIGVTFVDDKTGNAGDRVGISIVATANDKLVETSTQKTLFENVSDFEETWYFTKDEGVWMLESIWPGTSDEGQKNQALEDFANKNGCFYRLDMGWLLLPARGELFKDGKFGTSDINNHVIGLYNTQYILQMYTYIPDPSKDKPKNYLIAQTNVPKNYGRILVKRKKSIFDKMGATDLLGAFKSDGMQKVSLEWEQFNKKYEVSASDAEQVTAFELLHPVFLEKLEGLPFEVNIEVVDNFVYLFTEAKTSPEHYTSMLAILQEAYKQMKL